MFDLLKCQTNLKRNTSQQWNLHNLCLLKISAEHYLSQRLIISKIKKNVFILSSKQFGKGKFHKLASHGSSRTKFIQIKEWDWKELKNLYFKRNEFVFMLWKMNWNVNFNTEAELKVILLLSLNQSLALDPFWSFLHLIGYWRDFTDLSDYIYSWN